MTMEDFSTLSELKDGPTAPQDVKSPDVAMSPSHRNDNDEKNVDNPKDEIMPLVTVNNEETTRPDKITDRVEVKEENGSLDVSLLDTHVKDENKEIKSLIKADLVEMSTLCSHSEQIASSAESENALESSDHFKATPDSTNCKESPPVDGSDKEVTSESGKTSSGGSERPSAGEPLKDSETVVSEWESCKANITASQVSEIAQESEADTGRVISGFDLNQEVCSEEVDNPINLSGLLPSALLQFEGTLGWKGSDSTSAFRHIPDSSRAHNNSKQRLDCLDIDLNVAEDSDDKMAVISGLPSGEESSVEVGPRRPERMQLDLNSIGDEGGGLDWGRDEQVAPVNQNGWQSPSRSSSSSSKQPSLRNIDLNLNDSPVFNGFAPGAGVGAGAAMFFYGSPGGPVPCMVDSRGAPVVSQIMGLSQPLSPFIMNMDVAGSSFGSAGAEPLLHNFDLNTGLAVDGGNRETVGGLRQFFHHNGGSVDEQYLRANTSFQASSSSVVGGKRREPDAARWDLFPVNKHPQSPWR